MGTIRKVGDTYYIEFYARGLLYSQVAGKDEAAAQELLKKTEAKIAAGEALTVVRQVDLPVFFEQFLSYCLTEFNAISLRRFQSAIGHFRKFLQAKHPQVQQLSQVTPAVIEDYKRSFPSAKPALVNFTLLLLREVLDYGIKLGFINDNATLHVRLLSAPPLPGPHTKRRALAKVLVGKGVSIGKTCKLLKLSDIARVMYYANFIPLQREDMYN